jgi:uncharacterized zinc-type alcohol dehydrogenase-like protein
MKKSTIIFLFLQFLVFYSHLQARNIDGNQGAVVAHAYANYSTTDELKPYTFSRRELAETDVGIDISYCGICHCDLQSVKNNHDNQYMPLVPGHEIVGIVSAIGSEVTKYKIGDRVGVGSLVNSCGDCYECNTEQQQFCDHKTYTYCSFNEEAGEVTQGGYSDYIVVKEDFIVQIPDNLELAAAAPLLCAGATVYSALSNWDLDINDTLGVIGTGSLAQITIKMAKAIGAKVVLFTDSDNKVEGLKQFGADEVVVVNDTNKIVEEYKNSFDLIVDTLLVDHDINCYLECLARDATFVFVGVPTERISVDIRLLATKRRGISASKIAGFPDTQYMLEFCSENDIKADIEIIAANDINQAHERMLRNDANNIFVIDATTFKSNDLTQKSE